MAGGGGPRVRTAKRPRAIGKHIPARQHQSRLLSLSRQGFYRPSRPRSFDGQLRYYPIVRRVKPPPAHKKEKTMGQLGRCNCCQSTRYWPLLTPASWFRRNCTTSVASKPPRPRTGNQTTTLHSLHCSCTHLTAAGTTRAIGGYYKGLPVLQEVEEESFLLGFFIFRLCSLRWILFVPAS